MAIQTDKIPEVIDRNGIYVVKGHTMETLCKLARRKWDFNTADFFTQEDDKRFAVRIRTDRPAPSFPYTMRSTLLGSDDPYNPKAPLALSLPNLDTWQRDRQPKNIDGIVTDGVIITSWVRFYIETSPHPHHEYTQTVFGRQEIKDLYGMTYYIGPEVIIEIDTVSGSGSAGGGI
jgi:hypothetical protein